jgi:endonuclease/exonuclease/phosphatase family metal-dependent hydrolase
MGQELLSCCADGIPDLVVLCEVENDSVLHDLTRRSLLRQAGYEYLMTSSPDLRGIDVALLYSPFSFQPVSWRSLRVEPVKNMRPTRDILYVSGRIVTGDTLHVFVVHAPSRYGGERYSRPFRLCVADVLTRAVDSLLAASPRAAIVVAGDFNDYHDSPALRRIYGHGLHNVTKDARGQYGAKGTYRYQGEWRSIDHVLVTDALRHKVESAAVHAPLFLLEEEKLYGGYRPRRTYNGMRYQPGFSDHLPLVVRFSFSEE